MLTVEQAEAIILGLVEPLDFQEDVEIVDLSTAFGRILATPVNSELDFPHWDNSAMDGYAVRHNDVKACSEQHPAILDIIEEIPAGYQPQRSLQLGQAARILTGAVMPLGADTVVMQEVTKREGDRVFILKAPQPQEFVRHRAAFYQAGCPLLSAGNALYAPEIAVLAAAQCTQLSVYRRLQVAILSTGDELVSPTQSLQAGQIVDSNQYALAAFVAQNGAIPQMLGIVRDEPEALKAAISQAILEADIVLSTGGVSVGDYDYVEDILAQLGAEIHIRSVAVKPGKPLTVATFPNKKLFFGLPGNPVSALVSCWRFVQPALRKLSGLKDWEVEFIEAIASQDLRSDGRRETYLWGQLKLVSGRYGFHPAGGSHSSGNLINLAGTTGLAMLPIGTTRISAEDLVRVMRIIG